MLLGGPFWNTIEGGPLGVITTLAVSAETWVSQITVVSVAMGRSAGSTVQVVPTCLRVIVQVVPLHTAKRVSSVPPGPGALLHATADTSTRQPTHAVACRMFPPPPKVEFELSHYSNSAMSRALDPRDAFDDVE